MFSTPLLTTTQKVREFCSTVEKGDVLTAEKQSRDIASFILSDGDEPKSSFVGNEGFRLCYTHLKLLLEQNSNSNTSTTTKNENQVKLQNLLASLMPTGKCGILSRDVPVSLAEQQQRADSSKLVNEVQREMKEKLVTAFVISSAVSSPAGSPRNSATTVAGRTLSSAASAPTLLQQAFTPLQLSNLSTTASKVTKWSSENYTLTTTNSEMMVQSVIDCCNNLAEAFYLPPPSSSTTPPSDTCLPLQLLCFLVAARAESYSYQKIQGTPIIAKKLLTDLLIAKKKFVQSCYSFESQRRLFGVVVPFVRFASLWFAPPAEPKQFASECLRIFLSSSSTGEPRRREREEGNPMVVNGDSQTENNNDDDDAAGMMTFDEKMKDRIENLPSLVENAKDDAEAGFSSIAQEMEFNDGAGSNTGRDVDRLVPFLRNVLFSASPFSAKDAAENKNLSFRRATAVVFDRVRDGSKYSEARSVMPSKSATGSMMGMDDSSATNNTSSKTGLERIASSLTE